MARVRVYIASSLDGFIAGEDDDLSWLPGAEGDAEKPELEEGALDYDAFMADVGAVLMGRRSYDAVRGLAGKWPYGKRPVLVATHRDLEPVTRTVRPAAGTIEELVEDAREAAEGGDVYLDGGAMIRQALDAGLVDDLVVTVVPVVLGAGVPLFAGTAQRHAMDLVGSYRYGSMLQMHLRPLTEPTE